MIRLCCAVLGAGLLVGCAAPKGAPWTILCREVGGPYRLQTVEALATGLKQTDGIRTNDVYVLDHMDGISRLYYGTYYRRTDATTGEPERHDRMLHDLEFIRQLGAGDAYYFRSAVPVRSPVPDVGDPQWLLSEASGVYSLQVAVFMPEDTFRDYKQAAYEYCKLLRSEGHEAWFFHTPTMSIVTVGSFGEDAAISEMVPNRDSSGRTLGFIEVRRLSPEVERLQQKAAFRHMLVNGAIERQRIAGQTEARPTPSQLIAIPRSQE